MARPTTITPYRNTGVRTGVGTPAFYTLRVTISCAARRIQAMQKSPEQWLEEVEPAKSQGILKLFLGYAPGVGKTYSMLSEAIRRASRGEEVVVGVVETHGRKATAELAAKLNTRGRLSRKWTSMPCSPANHLSPWWTSWRIPTSRAVNITSVTRT